MANIYKNNMVSGRPLFLDTPSLDTFSKFKSMNTENALLYRLRPSKEKWKIMLQLEKLFSLIAQFFVISRPNVMKGKLPWIIRAGGSQSNAPYSISFGNLWTYYHRFLNGDGQCSKLLKEAFNRMKKDEEAISSLARKKSWAEAKEAISSLGIKKSVNVEKNQKVVLEKLKKERDQFIQKNLNEIFQLKEGTSRLLLLNREAPSDHTLNGNLFCVITKQPLDKYSLRLFGSGELMRELQVVPMGGKEKVQRELCFENIPKSALEKGACFKDLLAKWVDNQSTTPKKILENASSLLPYKKEVESVNDFMTCSDRIDRLFWNIVKAFPVNETKVKQNQSVVEKKGLQKQMQLRADVLTLFDLFQNIRYDLKPHTENYQILVDVFKGVSAKVDRAHRKGYLSQEEIKKLNAEFAVIENAIQKAKKVPVSFKSQSTKPEFIKGLFLKDFHLKPKENLSLTSLLVNPAHRDKGKKPVDQPINIAGLTAIPMTLYENIDTQEAFLKAFRELFEKINKKEQSKLEKELALQEMSRFMNEVPFSLFKEDGKKNDQTFWWNFKNKEEAYEVMDKINQCTRTLIEMKKHVNSTQYEFESYLKMWLMGEFLISLASGKWLLTGKVVEGLIKFYTLYKPYYNRLLKQLSTHYNPDFNRYLQELTSTFPHGSYIQKKGMENDFEFIGEKNKKGEDVQFTDKERDYLLDRDYLINEFFEKIHFLREKHVNNHCHFSLKSSFNDLDGSLDRYFTNQIEEHWLRPISHPGLKNLYRYAISHPAEDGSHPPLYGIRIDHDDPRYAGGLNTPEAFHDNPEGIFNFFADYHPKESEPHWLIAWLFGLDKNKPNSLKEEIPSLDLTQEEKKRLLRLVRHETPQIELMAFMKENPHLMRDSEVRNFFDALFFGGSLASCLSEVPFCLKNENFLEEMPKQIDQEIQRLEKLINDALAAQPVKDPETLQSRFDTLLYYYEMKEKLRDCYLKFNHPVNGFSSSKNELAQLLKLSQTHAELQSSIGYAARVHLRALLPNHTQADIPDIVKDYALSRDYAIDKRNIDPAFEAAMMRHWQIIAKKCEETLPDLQSFLDVLCYQKDLALDGSKWTKEDKFIYRNKTYQVNLQTLDVSIVGEEGNQVQLPIEIVQHSLFKKIFGDSFKNISANVQEKGPKKIYSFTDASGHLMQIEWVGGHPSFYTKLPLEGGKWLQVLPDNPFKSEISTVLNRSQDLLKNANMGIKDNFHAFFKHNNEAEKTNALSALAGFRILMDPSAPHSFYCLDEKGSLVLQLNIKENKNGLVIHSATDHRTSPISTWQINLSDSIKVPALDHLSHFENKGNMLFWSRNGKLEKIELSRYQLIFTLKGNQLMCNEPFKGYSVDLSATLQEKKGLFQALVLKHPDPTKPKKLIVPQAEALVPRHEAAYPHARGFGKIRLFFESIYQALTGHLFKIEQRFKFGMDADRTDLSYTVFDIRPYTGEICEKKENWESDVLQIVKLALKTDQPAAAWEMLNYFQLKPQELNHDLIKELVEFIQKPMLNTGGEAALKLKLALQLKHCLRQNKQWKDNVKETLNKEMLKWGPILFSYGRKIPQELQLTKAERIELARLFKKNLPDYYEQHLKVYFVADGTSINLSSSMSSIKDSFDDQCKVWKQNRPSIEIEDRIEALEKTVDPGTRLSDEELSYPIPRLKEGIPLIDFSKHYEKNLFEIKEQNLPSINLNDYPTKTPYEKQALEEYQDALDEFKKNEKLRPIHSIKASKNELAKTLDQEWIPYKEHLEIELKNQKADIEAFIRKTTKEREQVAIYAGSQAVAGFDELRQALAFDDLAKLQEAGRLPSTLNVEQLKHKLIDYFKVLTRRNAYEAVIKLTEEILTKEQKGNQEEWDSMSEALYRLLTISRNFDPYKDPRLLIFTAQQFINLKPLDGGLDQLALLDALVKNPYRIVQAPTGAGKTAVLSVMRTLHKANGNNLVIQKVLPSLFQQTYDKFKDVLGDFYGTSIFALRFNLKMRLSKQVTSKVQNDQGEWEEHKITHSVFKEMYLNMLETMQNKGCVLTDYKSLPLLEQVFFKVGQELLDKQVQGVAATPLLKEHFHYLRKILILLENKADENMDEFDQPNRPIQKIQLDLGIGGSLLPDFIFKHSLEIYQMLLQDPDLGLSANIQSDLSEETRQKIIEKYSQKMAKKLAQEAGDPSLENDILQYIQGKNETVLPLIQGQSDVYKDRVALCKDQFSIYLPLTLRSKQGSRYARSDDGSKTFPAYNGEKHDAKFGTPLEQINYTIQDYLQAGITLHDLKPWLKEIKQQWEDTDDPIAKKAFVDRFHEILPNLSIIEAAQTIKTDSGAQHLLDQINQDQTKITPFLLARLRKMKTSGAIISMDPQNNVDMSRVVSAVSATMGAPESLHRQFQVDLETNGQIQANMVYRVKKRALQENVIAYDPAKPALMLKESKQSPHAIIDGAGAFKKPVQAAEILKSHSSTLEQVGYHKEDESIVFVGKTTGDLSKTGFYFSQSHTRGTDISLACDAKAILTLSEKDGIREVFQKEGRLRQNRQRYQLAMSKYQGIKTVKQEIVHAITQDAAMDAKDIFRKCKQEPRAIVRKAMRKQLFEAKTIADFLTLFQDQEWRSYFISHPEPSYQVAGSYFAERQHIQFDDQDAGKVLEDYKAELTKKAQNWGLTEAVKMLNQIQYSDELLAKMPEKVAPLGSVQGELETEIEVEQEEEAEEEQEMELEFETETQQEQVKAEDRALGVYPIRLFNTDKLVHSVSSKINPAYDPLLKVTDSFLPFSRVGTATLHQKKPFDEAMYRIGSVYFDADAQGNITEVIIEDPLPDLHIEPGKACYDIRTNSFTENEKFKNLQQSPQFVPLIAQIKFLDGRINSYSPQELQELENWMNSKDPKKMRDHLLNQILCYRYQDKQGFVGSQVGQLFDKLIPA